MYRVLCFLLEIRLTKQSASKAMRHPKKFWCLSAADDCWNGEQHPCRCFKLYMSSWHKLLEISRFEAGFHPSAHFGGFFMWCFPCSAGCLCISSKCHRGCIMALSEALGTGLRSAKSSYPWSVSYINQPCLVSACCTFRSRGSRPRFAACGWLCRSAACKVSAEVFASANLSCHTMPYSDHCTGSGARKSQRCSKAISFHSCTTKLSWTHPILYLLVNTFQVSKCIQCIQPRTAFHSTKSTKKLRFVMAFMVLGCYCIQAIPQWLCCSAMGSAECGRPCILAPSWWRYAAWMGSPGWCLSIPQYRSVQEYQYMIYTWYIHGTYMIYDQISTDCVYLCVIFGMSCQLDWKMSREAGKPGSIVSKDMAEVIGGLTALIANSRRPW